MSYTAIDLSLLPPPAVVQQLDYEQILAARIAQYLAQYPEAERPAIAARLQLESDPALKLLQESAYRELQLRAEFNDGAHAVMLAYAQGADLDQLGANVDVQRLVITPANPNSIPPTPAVMESDDDFRRRIQLNPEGYTTAGSVASYLFHALGASGQVRDAQPVSPAPVEVVVYVMSRSGTGVADEQLLAAVERALNAENVRPMTDQVTVQSVAIVNYQVEAELVMLPGPDSDTVLTAALAALHAYIESKRQIGHDIPLSGIYAALHQPGVQRVILTEPAADIVIPDGSAGYCTAINVTRSELTDV